MLFVPGSFEVATRLFGLVGLTFTKLSAWLPDVALAFTTGSRQVSGVNRLNGLTACSGGLMHLRVPSGTLMRSVAANTCACKVNILGMTNAKTAARAVRRRRVFIYAAGKSGLKRTQNRRDSSMISQRMSSLVLSAKIWCQSGNGDRTQDVTLVTSCPCTLLA